MRNIYTNVSTCSQISDTTHQLASTATVITTLKKKTKKKRPRVNATTEACITAALERVQSKDGGGCLLRFLSQQRPIGRWVPEERASLLSRWTFAWVGGLMWLGNGRQLAEEDLWDLAPQDEAEEVGGRLEGAWEELGGKHG